MGVRGNHTHGQTSFDGGKSAQKKFPSSPLYRTLFSSPPPHRHHPSSSTAPDGLISSAAAKRRRGDPIVPHQCKCTSGGGVFHDAGWKVPRLVGPKQRLLPLVLIPTTARELRVMFWRECFCMDSMECCIRNALSCYGRFYRGGTYTGVIIFIMDLFLLVG